MNLLINLERYQIYTTLKNDGYVVRKVLASGNVETTIFKDFDTALSYALVRS